MTKVGVVELAHALSRHGVEIVSTGSTAATIEAAGIAVTPVSEVTKFRECLTGGKDSSPRYPCWALGRSA